MAPAKSKKSTLKRPKSRTVTAKKAPAARTQQSTQSTQTSKKSNVASRSVKTSSRANIYEPPNSEDEGVRNSKKAGSFKRKKEHDPIDTSKRPDKRQRISPPQEAPSAEYEEASDSVLETSAADAAQTLVLIHQREATKSNGTTSNQHATGTPTKRTRANTMQKNVKEDANKQIQSSQPVSESLRTPQKSKQAHATLSGQSATPAPVANMGTRNPNSHRLLRSAQNPEELHDSMEDMDVSEDSGDESADDDAVLDFAPNRAKQPILAREYDTLDMPSIEDDGFFGLGATWNEILQHRQVLLKYRVELATTTPLWYHKKLKERQHYPFSVKGQKAMEEIEIEPNYLVPKLRLIDQSLKRLSKNRRDQIAFVHADLCHLIIPRLIRCIAQLAELEEGFEESEKIKNEPELAAIQTAAELLKTLSELCDVASEMTIHSDGDWDSKIHTTLVAIHRGSQQLFDVTMESLAIERTRAQLAREEAASIERQRQQQRTVEDRKIKAASQEMAWQRKLEEKRAYRATLEQKAATQLEESEHRSTVYLDALRAEDAEIWRVEQDLREKKLEQDIRIAERQRKLQRQEAEKRAAANMNLWMKKFETDIRLREQHARDYYTKLSRALSVQKQAGIPRISNSKPPRPSTSNAMSWTKELSSVLINRLAMFEDLSQEERYARCLDCEELQTMSIEMVRARALEMKPTLEEWYSREERSVPDWVITIS